MSEIPTGSIRPPCRREDAEAVLRRLREAGHVAYFAGGCVRDLLLGLEPKDWDVATDAPPPRVRQLFPRTQAVGAKFGVILVRQNGSVVEVATFRTDVAYKDGRHPTEVRFTTPEEDAQRRDFTINGLFLDPLDDRVIDFVGGREDLNNKLLRAIGDANLRFEEDHLRMLRAVRFAARFELTIEQDTANAIVRHAEQLKRISPERIAEEMRLMLGEPWRVHAWPLLWRLGLINVIFRHIPTQTQDSLVPERSVLLALSPGEPMGLAEPLAAAILCYRWQRSGGRDIREFLGRKAAIDAVKAMRQALRISNDEADELHEILDSIAPFLDDQPASLATKKRFLAKHHHPATMELMEAIAKVGACNQARWPQDLYELYDTDYVPEPLLTGDDLTAAGYKPGPAFKRVLDQVYDAQLEDQIKTKDEALELARKLMP